MDFQKLFYIISLIRKNYLQQFLEEEDMIKNFNMLSVDHGLRDLHDVLTELAYSYYNMLIKPEKLNLIRVIIAESGKFPQIGKTLYDQGY